MDWLIVFIGIVIGAVVTAYVFCRNFVGTLRVDQSDPTDAPYLFLEIEKGMGDISRKKYVDPKDLKFRDEENSSLKMIQAIENKRKEKNNVRTDIEGSCQ